MHLIRLLKFTCVALIVGAIAALVWLAHFALTPIDVPAEARELTVKPGRSVRGRI